MNWKYQLIKGGKKWNCPGCGQKRFVRMENTETKEPLPDQFGKCDRVDNCGYSNLKPIDHFEKQPFVFQNPSTFIRPRAYIPQQLVSDSLTKYEINPLVEFLTLIAGQEKAHEAVRRYRIGTSSKGVVFWYIDQLDRVHHGAVMGYEVKSNPDNHSGKDCKRIKDKNTSAVKTLIEKFSKRKEDLPEWIKQYEQNEEKIGCPFGMHLLNEYPTQTICMVEAPKTAIIASLYLPQFTWMAIGAKSWLKVKRCEALKGRTVILWPDLGAFEEWKQAAENLSPIGKFLVNDLLEKSATNSDRVNGLDLADYLLKQPINRPATEPEPAKIVENVPHPSMIPEVEPPCVAPQIIHDDWTNRILSLQNYFDSGITFPASVKLNNCTAIRDPQKFIQSHLSIIKANNGHPTFSPYLGRLEMFKAILENQNTHS